MFKWSSNSKCKFNTITGIILCCAIVSSCSSDENELDLVINKIQRPSCTNKVTRDSWIEAHLFDNFSIHFPEDTLLEVFYWSGDTINAIQPIDNLYNINFGYCNYPGTVGVTRCNHPETFQYETKVSIDYPDTLNLFTSPMYEKVLYCQDGKTIALLYWGLEVNEESYFGILFGKDPEIDDELYMISNFNSYLEKGFEDVIDIYNTLEAKW